MNWKLSVLTISFVALIPLMHGCSRTSAPKTVPESTESTERVEEQVTNNRRGNENEVTPEANPLKFSPQVNDEITPLPRLAYDLSDLELISPQAEVGHQYFQSWAPGGALLVGLKIEISKGLPFAEARTEAAMVTSLQPIFGAGDRTFAGPVWSTDEEQIPKDFAKSSYVLQSPDGHAISGIRIANSETYEGILVTQVTHARVEPGVGINVGRIEHVPFDDFSPSTHELRKGDWLSAGPSRDFRGFVGLGVNVWEGKIIGLVGLVGTYGSTGPESRERENATVWFRMEDVAETEYIGRYQWIDERERHFNPMGSWLVGLVRQERLPRKNEKQFTPIYQSDDDQVVSWPNQSLNWQRVPKTNRVVAPSGYAVGGFQINGQLKPIYYRVHENAMDQNSRKLSEPISENALIVDGGGRPAIGLIGTGGGIIVSR